MDTNWQRGNKFFLPKIEYTRFPISKVKRPELTNTVASVSHEIVNESVDEENNNKRGDSEMCEEFLLEKQANDRPAGASFTKFAVLPPIQDQRNLHRKHYKRIPSAGIEKEVSDERELEFQRKGIFLRRQTALLSGERDRVMRSFSEELEIVGQGSTRNNQKLKLSENETLKISRPLNSPGAAGSLSDCVNVENAQLTEDFNRPSCKSYSNTETRSQKFKRFNSDSTYNNAKIFQNKAGSVRSSAFYSGSKPTRDGGLSLDIKPGSRPISRCQIDINMNEMEPKFNKEATETKEIPSTQSNSVENTFEFVEISTEDSSKSDNPSENRKPPSIQILIDTLDSAKHEIPDKLELPKMSIREQRRRSALCRVNSKQVDDFLLVHNLKDLGLL